SQLDADGKLDLVLASPALEFSPYTDGDLEVLHGNGNGTFGPPRTLPSGTSPTAVTVADLNGDGRPDLAMADYGYYDSALGYGQGAAYVYYALYDGGWD